jgi:hypothetical protein
MEAVGQSITPDRWDFLLSKRDTRDWRPLIFLAVLIFHAAFVVFVIRTDLSPISSSTPINEPLVLLLLPHKVRVAAEASMPPRPEDRRQLATPEPRPSKSEAAPSNAIPVAPEESKIDWEKEAELATQNALANAGREDDYRNLSALSQEQLSWARQNHFEPAPPGIPWKYRRVEVTEGGFPIIHINDHCVAIPLMMFMVFCTIGHIEPNGDLFEHMRAPHDP